MPNHSQKRSQEKIRRVLQLIDVMAPLRLPKSVSEIAAMYEHGRCLRTVRRDLDLLVSMGMVKIAGRRTPLCVQHRKSPQCEVLYLIDRQRTEQLQRAALMLSQPDA